VTCHTHTHTHTHITSHTHVLHAYYMHQTHSHLTPTTHIHHTHSLHTSHHKYRTHTSTTTYIICITHTDHTQISPHTHTHTHTPHTHTHTSHTHTHVHTHTLTHTHRLTLCLHFMTMPYEPSPIIPRFSYFSIAMAAQPHPLPLTPDYLGGGGIRVKARMHLHTARDQRWEPGQHMQIGEGRFGRLGQRMILPCKTESTSKLVGVSHSRHTYTHHTYHTHTPHTHTHNFK